ncbi:hypothetical protein GC175_17030 [bacterium]|nr:hypothetical protein [bacterium]
MTHGLWLRVDDSLSQINMVNATLGYRLLGYAPESTSGQQELVTETCRLYVSGSTVAELQERLQIFDTYFSMARLREQQGTGSKIWVELKVSGESDTYRSEIIDGRCVYDESALRYWSNTAVELTLIWVRRNWWESKTFTELPLKNGSVGAKQTGGITIFNHDDSGSGHDNWMDIDGDDVAGAIPAPLYLQLLNTSGANLWANHFYVSNNVFGGYNSPMILEGEDSTGGGSGTANAAHSGGEYRTYAWGSAISHSTLAYIWTLDQLSNMYGHWFNVLARFATAPPADTFIQLSVRFPHTTPLTTLWKGPEIELDANRLLQNLGAVPLPPTEIRPVPYMALVLTVRKATAGSLNIDFLQLSGPNGLHHFRQVGYQLETTDSVVIDGPESQIYALDASTYRWPIYSEYSPPVQVWPGKDQRIRVLFDEGTTMNIARTWTARAWYKPRRVTL